jgi:atypical dual specificity phosphatase
MASALTGSIYRATLLWDIVKNAYDPKNVFPWWNQIDAQIYLGAIPLLNKNHITKFKELGIDAVVTILEMFEIQTDTYISQPVKGVDWKANNIENQLLLTQDYSPIQMDKLNKGVEFMHDQITNGHTVYVHCKSGKGRSPTLIACYLLKYGLSNGKKFALPSEAIEYIREKRNIINLNEGQKNIVYEFWENLL